MQVGIAELKARLSEYLTRVQAGEELIVADRGKPVARIVPVRWQQTDDEDCRLLDLQWRGFLRFAQRALSEQFWEASLFSPCPRAQTTPVEASRSQGGVHASR